MDLPEPVEIIAGEGKIILAQELSGGEDFRLANRRSDMDPGLQGFDKASSVPLMVFGGHDLVHFTPVRQSDNCAFGCTPTGACSASRGDLDETAGMVTSAVPPGRLEDWRRGTMGLHILSSE